MILNHHFFLIFYLTISSIINPILLSNNIFVYCKIGFQVNLVNLHKI
jgi:hypothetical protein